jgi:hypothetical protein
MELTPSTGNGKVSLGYSFHIFKIRLNISVMGVIVPRDPVIRTDFHFNAQA